MRYERRANPGYDSVNRSQSQSFAGARRRPEDFAASSGDWNAIRSAEQSLVANFELLSVNLCVLCVSVVKSC